MDSRFHGNDTNAIIVIPAKAGIHPMQDSFPRYLPKSQKLKLQRSGIFIEKTAHKTFSSDRSDI
jgi:hypothetical protein